jgi:hypothetical protein
MPSSEMLRRVALIRTKVSEERFASNIRVARIGELGTTLAVGNVVPSLLILFNIIIGAIRSSETSVLTFLQE